MTPPAVGNGTLRRLSDIGAGRHPVLSIYLDLDPSRFPTPAARETELDALTAHARRDGAAADAAQVRELIRREPALLQTDKGLAVFSCVATGTLETVSLPAPVEPMAIVDSAPWLEPLVAMLTAENWGIAVVGRRTARLLRGGRRGLIEFAAVDDAVHGRHAQGGWSQANYQRSIEQDVAAHVRHAAAQLLRAHRRRPFDHVVVVAAPELWPQVEASLHAELRERLAGHVEHDLAQAPAGEILDTVAPLVEVAQRARERSLLARLDEQLPRGGAAAGLDEVLDLLDQDRAATLLIAHDARLTAWRCPRCGMLSASAQRRCEHDAPLAAVDAAEHLIDEAARRRVETVVVSFEPDALHAHGSIAALLRW